MRRKITEEGNYKIHEIRVLNENDRAAKNVLALAAREVEPIMQKRKWNIQTLEEFSLPDRRFVGLYIKSESKIKLRLRSYVDAPCMYHYDFIIGSLLHELAHIQYSSHGKRFQALLQNLKDEYNMLYCSHIETPIKLDCSVFKNEMGESIDLDAYDIVYEIEQSGCVTPLVFIDSSKVESANNKHQLYFDNRDPIILPDDDEIYYNEIPPTKKHKSFHSEDTEVIDMEAYSFNNGFTANAMETSNEDVKKATKRPAEEEPKNQKNKKKGKWDVPENQIIVID